MSNYASIVSVVDSEHEMNISQYLA